MRRASHALPFGRRRVMLRGMKPSAKCIVSLLSSATEMVCALGIEDRLAAISHECDYPPSILDRPRVTRTHINADAASAAIDAEVLQKIAGGEPLYEIDAERIVTIAPDLIITQAQCDVCAVRYADVERLAASTADLAGTRIMALAPNSVWDVLDDMMRLGREAGCIDAAEACVANLRRRVDAVRCRAAEQGQRPRVALIEWTDPVMLAGNWMPELIELAGGTQPLTVDGAHSTCGRWEDVLTFDPEVLIVAPCGFGLERALAEAHEMSHRRGWCDLAAVRVGRVFAVDGNAYFNRAGPRLVDSLELLAEIIQNTTPSGPAGGSKRLV